MFGGCQAIFRRAAVCITRFALSFALSFAPNLALSLA